MVWDKTRPRPASKLDYFNEYLNGQQPSRRYSDADRVVEKLKGIGDEMIRVYCRDNQQDRTEWLSGRMAFDGLRNYRLGKPTRIALPDRNHSCDFQWDLNTAPSFASVNHFDFVVVRTQSWRGLESVTFAFLECGYTPSFSLRRTETELYI